MPSSPFADIFSQPSPPAIAVIQSDTAALGFTMASTKPTGIMLATLAASKPHGHLLELGTGTGLGTVWLLHGMSADATLDTVDNNPACVAIAQRHFVRDHRVHFHIEDGSAFLRAHASDRFDLIYADTWPGKFTDLDLALSLLNPGGIYVIDDLLPQPNWPADHAPKIPLLMEKLAKHPDLFLWPLEWDTGIVVAARKA